MNVKKYVESVLKTKSPHYNPENIHPDLVHSVLGLVTEAGELADIIKRAYFYGKGPESVDRDHIVEELGDLMWYLALASAHLDVPIEDIMAKNIAKLKARYNNKWTQDAALNRNLEAEASALKGEA